jgi:hypothetical protein
MEKSNVKPITYALIALIIFSLLGLEFPMLFLSRLVDGRPASQAFSWPMNWYGAVFHWTVTILIWAAGAVGVFLWTKKKGVLPDLIRFEFKSRDGIWLVIGILFVIAYELIYSWLAGLSIPQIGREYRGFQNLYGTQAWIVAIFQNLYYLVEYLLVVMMIAFFQRAGELWFKSSWFPWGGTWYRIDLGDDPPGDQSPGCIGGDPVGCFVGHILCCIEEEFYCHLDHRRAGIHFMMGFSYLTTEENSAEPT